MCRSCVEPFNGKYCQQCEYCGHPAHTENLCGVGIITVIPRINGDIESIGCLCKEERYDK
jgi:hypothetical protein